MTKFVRNPLTGKFLGSGAQWTPDLSNAEPVADYGEAAALVKFLGLRTVELYYCFSDTMTSQDWDFAIRLETAAWSSA